MTIRRISIFLAISIAAGMLLGALIAYLGAGVPLSAAGGFTLTGWAAASLLTSLSLFLILLAWSWAGRLKSILVIMLLAFFLRLGIGITLGLGLDKWGHFNMQNEAGYLYLDPYRRDTDGWKLATSGNSLIGELRSGFSNDQYGGLMTISAFIYRYLSPDGHRPFLILILTALAGAIGIPFLWKAIEPRWKKRVALITCLVVAFYPEAVILGSSQTREPFLIGLFSIAFWALLTWKEHIWKSILTFLLSLLGLVFINTMAAGAVAAFLAVWFILDLLKENPGNQVQILAWIGISLAAVGVAVIGWYLLRDIAKWDALVSYNTNGFIELVIKKIGKAWLIPFVSLYGLIQPSLPAALVAHSAKPLWTGIAIFRSVGWYALVPFLLYALIVIWKVKNPKEKRLLVWTALFSLVWVIISSYRAGGDEWDNPRYRAIFIPILALLAAWAIDWARVHRDSWLTVLLIVEGLFLVIFINLYLVRYLNFGIRIQWYWDVVIFVVLSAILLIGNIFLQRKKRNE